ncbi:MAG: hypothetical protein JNL58_23855 [Planctomyces sp.]|nr:hypothetical protein [Planctomyces sp.]
MFRLCREGVGGHLSAHPDYLGQYLNARQLMEWQAYERLEPFEPERADARSALETFWLRQTMLEKHNAEPEHYRIRWEPKTETEAAGLFAEMREIAGMED